MNKKIFIVILFLAAVILIFVNILFDNYAKQKQAEAAKKVIEVSRTTLENKLTKTMLDFGITEEHMNISSYRNPETDSLPHKFKITLPADVPHILLLQDYFEALIKFEDISYDVNELKINTRTNFKVLVKDHIKLDCTLYSDTLKRNYPTLVFILQDFEDADVEIIEELMSLPDKFGVFLTPSKSSFVLKQELERFNKGFFILLNDDTEDEYKIKEGMDRRSLGRVTRKITSSFKGNFGYIIDTKCDIYRSVSYNFIRDSFRDKGVTFKRSDKLKYLNSESYADAKSRIYFHARSAEPGDVLYMLIDTELFYNIRDVLNALKKFGYKIDTKKL